MKRLQIKAGFLLLACALLPFSARPVDVPHNIVINGDVCVSCHMTHSAPGASITSKAGLPNLCMSCHKAGGSAPTNAFTEADQAVAWPGLPSGVTNFGTSHRWDSGVAGYASFLGGSAIASSGRVTSAGAYSGAYAKAYTLTITNSGSAGAARFVWTTTLGGGGTNLLTSTNGVALDEGVVAVFSNGPAASVSFRSGDVWRIYVRNDLVAPTNALVWTNILGGAMSCATCHDEHSQQLAPFDTNAPAYVAGNGMGRHCMRVDNSSEQLCNDCHAPRNVTNAMYGSHPVGIALFADGTHRVATNLPLEGATGLLRCESCHQLHRGASSDGKLLRVTNTLALCTSCHTLANTSAPAAHFNLASAPLRWPGGQYGSLFPARTNTADRGTCDSCHFVHGWPNATNTAVHNPDLLVDYQENLCFTCHDSDGPAAENVKDDFAKKYDHPVGDSDAWRRPGRPVECNDCHNPHKAMIGVHTYTNIATAARNDATNAPVLAGVDGVAVSYTSLSNFQVIASDRYTYIPDSTGAAHEYEICFKCHTGYGFPTYAGGTASFASNITTVTGSGTAWTTNLVGMWISKTNDFRSYVITAVASATSLTISPAYGSTSASGQGFFIRNTPPNQTPIYGAGTATFTPGSATVTGTGTAWNSGLLGSWIYASNNPAAVYMIVAVNNATNLTIAPAYR